MSSLTEALPLAIIWLDGSDDSSEEHIFVREQLTTVDEQLQVFSRVQECENCIRSQPPSAAISLIVSGSLGKILVPLVVHLPQIKDIYVYCQNQELHKVWADEHNKVRFHLLVRSRKEHACTLDF